ncbi:MAG: glycoside hydrolase [Clostridium sp.]|nr:glycoside hydrolase [Clostridium sp.]
MQAKSLLLSLLCFGATTVGGSAFSAAEGDGPSANFAVTVSQGTTDANRVFIPTTLTEDGQFAPKTVWYTMQIGTAQMLISDNGDADRISLNRIITELEPKDLWCFVGDSESGYRIYNKAAGAGKVLASATTMGSIAGVGGTGGSTYPTLQAVDALPEGYVDLWDFAASDKINLEDVEGQFVQLHGTNYALNNFGGRGVLAFWAEGKDAGSTVAIRFAETTVPVVKSEGSMTEGALASDNYYATWTYGGVPRFTISSGTANNMKKAGDDFMIAPGAGGCNYTIATSTDYSIGGYAFDFVSANADATIHITPEGGETVTGTNSESQSIRVDGLKENTAGFAMAGTNTDVVLNNFTVTVRRAQEPVDEAKKILFAYGNDAAHNIVYRIPAIATVGTTGRLVAISDYRYCGADIGNGRIDLHVSLSDDNGQTWTEPDLCRDAQGNPVTQGTGKGTFATSNENRDCGFGDAAIVGDRESERVLMLSVCGRTPFFSATREIPNSVARWYSEDGGTTWTAFQDITEQIYTMFDGTVPYGYIDSMFFGSGRIMQSSRVKVGEYYRLYAVMSGRNTAAGPIVANWVLYSDDFGQTWNFLGDPMTPPIPSGADEPKAEELPDGSVICSTRVGGGRRYNLFSYTDVEKGEGFWGNDVKSTLVKASGNACNGEIMILPVEEKATGKKMYLALQSVPFGPSDRSHVGINYKKLEGYEDYGTVENFAAGWDGAYQVTKLGSAYSTMTWQHDDKLAFFWEESTYGKDYCEAFKTLSIEEITDSAFCYCPDTDGAIADSLTRTVVAARAEAYRRIGSGTSVGQFTGKGIADIEAAAATYAGNSTMENFVAFNMAVDRAEKVELESGRKYRLRNYGRGGDLYLKALSDNLTVSTRTAANLNENDLLFAFITNEDGSWRILNEEQGVYIGSTGATETRIPVVANVDEAAAYRVSSTSEGLSSLTCLSPVNKTYPAIHLAGDKTRLVPWQANSPSANDASFWYIEPTDLKYTGISEVMTETVKTVAEPKFYDLSGRRVDQPARGGIYVTDDRRKVVVK